MVGSDADVLVHVEHHDVAPGHVGSGADQLASTKAIWELPVANMAWATPLSATAARRILAASSAAARAMAVGWCRTRTTVRAAAHGRTVGDPEAMEALYGDLGGWSRLARYGAQRAR